MADQPVAADKTEKPGTIILKPAKMQARGKVIEISETSVKIERTVKDKAEIMEFILENPAANIDVNDFIKVSYTVNDGKLVASRITKVKVKKK
jgi:hypothetical protein